MGGRVGGLAQWQIVELGEHLDFMGVFQQCGCHFMHNKHKSQHNSRCHPLEGGGVNDPFV